MADDYTYNVQNGYALMTRAGLLLLVMTMAPSTFAASSPFACAMAREMGSMADFVDLNCAIYDARVIPGSLKIVAHDESGGSGINVANLPEPSNRVTAAGTRILSARLNVGRMQRSALRLRASAAIRGQLQRIWSDVHEISVGPVPVTDLRLRQHRENRGTGFVPSAVDAKPPPYEDDTTKSLRSMALPGPQLNAVVSFDDLQDSQVLTNQVANGQFTNAVVLAKGISLNEFEFPPHSDPNVAADNGGPMTIAFSPPVLSFGGYFTYSTAFSMTAFDAAGHVIGSANSKYSSNMALSGVTGSSPNEFMQILAPATNHGIAKITITGAAGGSSFAMDDVQLTIPSYVRDFRGIGRSDALLYETATGTAYTALSSANGLYQYVYNLFTPAFDTVRSGDFNGDGKADLIVYNSQTALTYIGMGNGDGTFAFQSLFWSPNYDIVEMGDINGDRRTDVALYTSTTGTLYTGISNSDGTFSYTYHLVSKGFTFIRLADFTGDGKADLFLYNSNSGLAFLGVGDGASNFAFNPLFISPGYNLADIGDLNGDGKMDLILYNTTTGNAATGISDGAGGFAFTPMLFSPGFTSVRLADYTGDSKADVTVYNKNTAAAYFGTGMGTGTFNFQSLFWSPNYNLVEPEDVNGDGTIDVVLYNSLDGTEYTGISNGNGTFAYTYQYWGIGKILGR